MKLPNAKQAIVQREKIVEYLLNASHRYGGSKARFFTAFGFKRREWETFAQALHKHGVNHEVMKVRETGFGPRYEVEGPLESPDGRHPVVRTVWQHDHAAPAPRLITAYPLEDG